MTDRGNIVNHLKNCEAIVEEAELDLQSGLANSAGADVWLEKASELIEKLSADNETDTTDLREWKEELKARIEKISRSKTTSW